MGKVSQSNYLVIMSEIWLSKTNVNTNRFEEIRLRASAYQNADSLFEVGSNRKYKTIADAVTAAKAWRQAQIDDGGIGAQIQAQVAVYNGVYDENISIGDGINFRGVAADAGEVLVNGKVTLPEGQEGQARINNITFLADVDNRTDSETHFVYSTNLVENFKVFFDRCLFIQKNIGTLYAEQREFFLLYNCTASLRDCAFSANVDSTSTDDEMSVFRIYNSNLFLLNSEFFTGTDSGDFAFNFIEEVTGSDVTVSDSIVSIEINTADYENVLTFIKSLSPEDKDAKVLKVVESDIILKINSDQAVVANSFIQGFRLLGTGQNSVQSVRNTYNLLHGLGSPSVPADFQKAHLVYIGTAAGHKVVTMYDLVKRYHEPYQPLEEAVEGYLVNTNYHITTGVGNVYISGVVDAKNFRIDGILVKAIPLVTVAGSEALTIADVGEIEKTIDFDSGGTIPKAVYVTLQNEDTDGVADTIPDTNPSFITASVTEINTSSFTVRFSAKIPTLTDTGDTQAIIDPGYTLHYILDLSDRLTIDYDESPTVLSGTSPIASSATTASELTINFPIPFASVPTVYANIVNTSDSIVKKVISINLTEVTTTGFKYKISADTQVTGYRITWMAQI